MGEFSVRRATSYIRYDKESEYRRLIYHLKYYGHPDIGRYMGRCAAITLVPQGFFNDTDLIVPVPVSERKRRQRGYNQCDYIANGVASVTGIPIETDALNRSSKGNNAQARKGRFQRWGYQDGVFQVTKPEKLINRNLLIVDDVVTTGATLSSLIGSITKACTVRSINVLTLSLAT